LDIHYTATKEAVFCSVREFSLSCADLNYEVLICIRTYIIINNNLFLVGGGGGTKWRSWLRHCAKNRKVAGSILDGVIGIFP